LATRRVGLWKPSDGEQRGCGIGARCSRRKRGNTSATKQPLIMSSSRKKTPSRPPVADPPGCAGRSAADRSAPGCVHDARGAIDAKPVEARCEYNAAVLRQGASERWRDVTMRVVMDEDDNGRERERESFPEVELLLTDEAERLALRVLAMDMAGNFSGQPPERQIARCVAADDGIGERSRRDTRSGAGSVAVVHGGAGGSTL
jgi:hypothetical protein